MPDVVAVRRLRRRTLRSALALLTSGVIALPVLAGCTTAQPGARAKPVPMDIGAAAPDRLDDGGTLHWAVDAVPATFNAFQADADAATSRVTGAVLPALFRLDEHGRPQRNADYLVSAEVTQREPRQVVVYKLSEQAVWGNGREIGAPDFVAQWRALSGKDTAYWSARNAGYDRIEKVERGKNDLEVRVTFAKPYADWQALFTPLYPKEVMGAPAAFNEEARKALKTSAGPFMLQSTNREAGTVTLVRNPRWWGTPARLDSLVLRAVARDKRATALAAGTVDVAEIDRSVADRIAVAVRDGKNGPTARTSGAPGTGSTPTSLAKAYGADEDEAETAQLAGGPGEAAQAEYAKEQIALRDFVVRKSLEPAYTQLALNGESGPLADERVRRAVARALDRKALAETVLGPLGLPAQPVGSHVALVGQRAYADSSAALGGHDTEEAQALLADAGWTREGARQKVPDGTKAGAEADAGRGTAGKTPAVQNPAAPGVVAESSAAQAPATQTPAVPSGGVPGAESPGATEAGSGDEDQNQNQNRYAGDGNGSDRMDSSGTQDESDDSASGQDSGAAGFAPDDDEAMPDEDPGNPSDDKPGDVVPGREAGWNVLAPARSAAVQRAALRRQADALDTVDSDRTRVMDEYLGDGTHDDSAAGDEVDGYGYGAGDDKQGGGGMAGAYAPVGTRAPAPAGTARHPLSGPLGKDGKPLTLRFVLPSGPGSGTLRTVGNRIARMLDEVGIRTEITKVADESYFKDHIASGQYDLALYSWPTSAFPATDARPIFAKPRPAADGSLLVEQNYTRVGTDRIDQLFERALSELDEKDSAELVKQADAHIWAAAGSIPLYQRPQLVAVRHDLANVGAFGYASPRYQDIGFKQP
ncbi:ABC transporter substrate-binding protein [Streptomyces sp. NPDC019396]|uniref:ABC transporter substrate-binding protein n=1 Tax=Streptomyces sp. NPDC019396 TaxID=3154687 RepID=UPI00340E6204